MNEANTYIDLCSCYEPLFYPSKEQEEIWFRMNVEYAPEPTAENTSFYAVEPDGTSYFYSGNTRTRVSEFFTSAGNTMDKLIENVVLFKAGKTAAAEIR